MSLSTDPVAPIASTTPYVAGVLDDLVVDTPLRCEPPGHAPIAVIRTEDGVFAIDDTCTHQDTSLADGWVENCAVECPLHEVCFDLRTGAPNGPPATRAVATHPVSVVDGMVHVALPAHVDLPEPSADESVSGAA